MSYGLTYQHLELNCVNFDYFVLPLLLLLFISDAVPYHDGLCGGCCTSLYGTGGVIALLHLLLVVFSVEDAEHLVTGDGLVVGRQVDVLVVLGRRGT